MLVQVLLLILSIVALYYGAEFVLEAAERVGKFFGMPPLIIGLLLIGFGTSLPEFFVSQLASFRGVPGIAMGNIIGSNVANIFLILGISSLWAPLIIKGKQIQRHFILHLILTLLLIGNIYYGRIDWFSLSFYAVFFVSFLSITFREMRHSDIDEKVEHEVAKAASELEVIHLSFGLVGKLFLGFFLLFIGGEFLVRSGSSLASMLGVSDYVISAIFIAFGTSFPELVTAILACRKKMDTDLITGNIIGSNIFNVAFVLGSLGVYDIKLTSEYKTEMSFLFAASIGFIFLALMGRNISRYLGVILLSCYGYLVYFWAV